VIISELQFVRIHLFIYCKYEIFLLIKGQAALRVQHPSAVCEKPSYDGIINVEQSYFKQSKAQKYGTIYKIDVLNTVCY
jgi:hypothetical protein